MARRDVSAVQLSGLVEMVCKSGRLRSRTGCASDATYRMSHGEGKGRYNAGLVMEKVAVHSQSIATG